MILISLDTVFKYYFVVGKVHFLLILKFYLGVIKHLLICTSYSNVKDNGLPMKNQMKKENIN